MGKPYRYRRCPECGGEYAAGDFQPVELFAPNWQERGHMRRRCPNCGYETRTENFVIVNRDSTINVSDDKPFSIGDLFKNRKS